MKAGHFSDVYIGTRGGVLIDGAGWPPPASYDPRQRPWYRRAVAAGKHRLHRPLRRFRHQRAGHRPGLAADGRGSLPRRDRSRHGPRHPGREPAGGQGRRDRLRLHRQRQRHYPGPSQPELSDEGQTAGYRSQPEAGSWRTSPARPPGPSPTTKGGEANILAYTKIADSNWILCTTIPRAEAYRLARKTTVLFAAEIVLKVLGGIALLTLLFVFGSGLAFFVFSRRFTTTLQKQQEEISGINEDLAWNIHKRKELEKHYQTLFNVANDVILVSKDLTCIECNEKATEVFGYLPAGHHRPQHSRSLPRLPARRPGEFSAGAAHRRRGATPANTRSSSGPFCVPTAASFPPRSASSRCNSTTSCSASPASATSPSG